MVERYIKNYLVRRLFVCTESTTTNRRVDKHGNVRNMRSITSYIMMCCSSITRELSTIMRIIFTGYQFITLENNNIQAVRYSKRIIVLSCR